MTINSVQKQHITNNINNIKNQTFNNKTKHIDRSSLKKV